MSRLEFEERTHTYKLDGVEVPSVTKVITPCTCMIDKSRPWLAQTAAQRGTAVHEATMALDYGEEFEISAEYAGYITAYSRFLKDYAPEWAAIEFSGYSRGTAATVYGNKVVGTTFAGTIDRIGRIDGKPCILDIKTGQLHTAAITAQLTAYAHIASWKFDDFCPYDYDLYGLKLSKDGTYTLKKYDIDNELLEACIKVYNAVTRRTK